MATNKTKALPDESIGLPASLGAHMGGTIALLDGPTFERAMQMAQLMASANGLPGFFGRSPGTCLAAIEEGIRLGISPFVVAKNMYQVQGGPINYLGKFVMAVINTHPAIDGRITFEHVGPWERIVGKFKMVDSKKQQDTHGNPVRYAARNWTDADEEGCAVIARATMAATGEIKERKLFLAQCSVRNSTLWASDPEHQICYVAARRWVDRYAPEILMGMGTDAEAGEMIDITERAERYEQRDETKRPKQLERFVEQYEEQAKVSAADASAGDRVPEAPRSAKEPQPTEEQGSAAPSSDRPPTSRKEAVAPVERKRQESKPTPERKGPTMVELILQGRSTETLDLSTAVSVLVAEARGKPKDWIEAAVASNPWVSANPYARETMAALYRAADTDDSDDSDE